MNIVVRTGSGRLGNSSPDRENITIGVSLRGHDIADTTRLRKSVRKLTESVESDIAAVEASTT